MPLKSGDSLQFRHRILLTLRRASPRNWLVVPTFQQRSRGAFHYPIQPAPRTAILADWFTQSWFARGSTRIFREGWCKEAASFSPGAIAGTRQHLLALAARSDRPALTHALIVMARPADPKLSEADRQDLWLAFRVPLFEQIIGANGELLAAECEAHDGLHIENATFSWGDRHIDASPCACGRTTPRLAPIKPAERVRAVAAYAR